MKKTYLILCLGLAGITTFTASKKDSTGTSTPSSNAPTVSAPANADGAFAALVVKTTTAVYGTSYTIDLGTAAVWFGSATSFKDGGNVTVNDSALTKSNGAYVFQPSQTNLTGLTFYNDIVWDATGNSGNGIPAVHYSDNSTFPSVDDIASSTTVSSSGAFTLTASSSVYGSDSVIFVVAGSQKHLTYTAPGNTSSHTFSAADMATVGAAGNSSGLLQIAPYRVNHQTIGGKNYYFIKETCVNKFVTIN